MKMYIFRCVRQIIGFNTQLLTQINNSKMKKVVASLCLITCMVMCGGLVAQNNNAKGAKSIVNPQPPGESDTIKHVKWANSIEQFIGVWSLEKILEAAGAEDKIFHPGTFMVVHPNASYVIFVYTDEGAVITSQGNILVESPKEYVEVISQHVNSSLVGMSNRIDYKLTPTYLHKSFWIEKDKFGGDYKRQVNETWKRAKMHEGDYNDSAGYPI